MQRPILSLLLLAAAQVIVPAVTADTVYSWTDTEGVVHFSDNPPVASSGPEPEVERLSMPATWSEAPAPGEDYYSVTNQWQRLQQARDQREALSLQRQQVRINNAYRARQEGRRAASRERVLQPTPSYILPYAGRPAYHPRTRGHARSGISFEYRRSLGRRDGYQFGFQFGGRHGRDMERRHAVKDKADRRPRQRQFYLGNQAAPAATQRRGGPSSSGFSLGQPRDLLTVPVRPVCPVDRRSMDGIESMSVSPPFLRFGPDHLLALVVILLALVAVPLLSRRQTLSWQRHLALGLAAVLPLLEIAKIGVRVGVYDDPWGSSLPLHLCGITALLTAWMLWQRSYRTFEVAYFWALGGSTPALLTPDLIVGFPNPFYFLFFASHGLVMLGVLVAITAYGFRPRWRSLGKTIVASLVLILVMTPVNLLLDANYLYLRSKPGQASLMDYLGPWPWYVIGLVVLGSFICLLCYLPFALAGLHRRLTSSNSPRASRAPN